jgi:aspartate/tyrosine/aromatic aminotransferase
METVKVNRMFESAPLNPPDSIFGLIEQFKKDSNPNKINLTVGVYQDESGQTPVMQSVRKAEQKLLDAAGTKSYLPIDGSPSYNQAIGRLILGNDLMDQSGVQCASAQTPGGTVSLRIAGELLRRVFGVDTVWMSNPTWANHPQIFGAEGAGLNVMNYEYLDQQGTALDFERLVESLNQTQPNQAILLHTVCHNPTGVDPSDDQWKELASIIMERQLFPIFDFAYQGFGKDLEDDAFPIRHFVQSGGEVLVCNSFSKNFGLYAERVGGITAVSPDADTTAAMLSQIKLTIRTMYSNPPLHGGAIVDTILHDAELRLLWEQELSEIRNRILSLRSDFVEAMQRRLPNTDFSYINRQQGMFSYSGLTSEQVRRLKEEYGIYALGSGRINVAGINAHNLDRLCDAIAAVVTG